MGYSALTPDEYNAIREFISAIKNQFLISQIVLFGSKARKEACEYSDVDLLVLTSKVRSKRDREALSGITAEINIKYGVGLSCLYYNADDWKRGEGVNPSLKENVDKEGILLDI